ncbi:Hypothetical protein SRAE_1000130300 [Strongyloides ratti]|uniref:Uncharacterized protein n=1 Tax=Strongyloides ratti TaxID=34506 RepID=A0A090L4I6_STRRB|nr:Hypothetical protein SRAE_1000130300 [Strongyloides ratti]CEF63037.1 Hypothetical protein SRAE_1000130300 [Strongyloides ratti]
MQKPIYLLNRCLFLNNLFSCRTNFIASEIQKKTTNNILSLNLQDNLNKKTIDFSALTSTEDFGLLLNETDVYENKKNNLEIPTQPRILDFYSSLDFYTEAEKQHIDLFSFLDDVVHIEDTETTEDVVKITLDGERINSFNLEKMIEFVKNDDYENVVDELNNKKWPKFANNHHFLNNILKYVIENSSYDEAKRVIDDFAKSDYTAYLQNSVAFCYFTKVLEQEDLKTVINEIKRLKEIFLVDEVSMSANCLEGKEVRKDSDMLAQKIFDKAFEMKYSLLEIEKLWKALLSHNYIFYKSLFFEFAVSKLLEENKYELALMYRERQFSEFLKSSCFSYFYKYFITNNISPKSKEYKEFISKEVKMRNLTSINIDIIVCLLEMDEGERLKNVIKKASFTPLQYKAVLKEMMLKDLNDKFSDFMASFNEKVDKK